MSLHATGNPAADDFLMADPNTLLIGMLLDQQVPIEWAFAGPLTLRDRLGHLDPARIASQPVDDLVAVAATKPAIHRFPTSMAKRIHRLCEALVDGYDGSAANLWTDIDDASTLTKRLRALPGFGPEKSKIFVALLAKRFGVRPAGWERAAGVFSDEKPRSVADMSDAESAGAVRKWKAAQRAANLDKQGRPIPT